VIIHSAKPSYIKNLIVYQLLWSIWRGFICLHGNANRTLARYRSATCDSETAAVFVALWIIVYLLSFKIDFFT